VLIAAERADHEIRRDAPGRSREDVDLVAFEIVAEGAA
jgi:hypothetical protein